MARRDPAPDPVRLEVFHHLLAAVCEEAGALLQRTAMSVNIRERHDFSCALFDSEGRLMAQAAHIPVHLGSATDSVAAVCAAMRLAPGDVAILNDPFAGGTHLPDVTLVRGVFVGRRRQPSFFVVNRAHHADIGGTTPGSMGVAEELLAEGLVIPPVKLVQGGVPDRDVLALLASNLRGADERMADLRAQQAALELAERRLLQLVKEQGLETVETYAAHLIDYAEKIARSVVAAMPAGTYRATDCMEDDGLGHGPLRLCLSLTIESRHLRFDFRGTARQARGGINCNRSVVLAACIYLLRCLCPPRLPTNEGLYRLVEIVTEKGSLLDPHRGAAVAGGNVETSQRLVDLGLQALGKALPDRIPACSAGTMSNLAVGGEGFTFYETLPGGAGAGPTQAGTSGVQTHMTNTANTPVEEAELRYPVRITAFSLRRGSGGAGKHRGGEGIVKELELLAPARISLLAERHHEGPPGCRGGGPGRPGRAFLERRGKRRRLGSKESCRLEAGEKLRIETPGGGGWGRA